MMLHEGNHRQTTLEQVYDELSWRVVRERASPFLSIVTIGNLLDGYHPEGEGYEALRMLARTATYSEVTGDHETSRESAISDESPLIIATVESEPFHKEAPWFQKFYHDVVGLANVVLGSYERLESLYIPATKIEKFPVITVQKSALFTSTTLLYPQPYRAEWHVDSNPMSILLPIDLMDPYDYPRGLRGETIISRKGDVPHNEVIKDCVRYTPLKGHLVFMQGYMRTHGVMPSLGTRQMVVMNTYNDTVPEEGTPEVHKYLYKRRVRRG